MPATTPPIAGIFSRDRQSLIHHRDDIPGRQAAGNIRWAEEGADHTVFVDEDGRRRRHVFTMFPRSGVHYLNRINKFVAAICHNDQVRKVLLRLLRVIRTIDRNACGPDTLCGRRRRALIVNFDYIPWLWVTTRRQRRNELSTGSPRS